MTEPMVVCVCLTKDRPKMLRRAVACFNAQTYQNKRLLIYDTGEIEDDEVGIAGGVYHEWHPQERFKSVGELRNLANDYAHPRCLNGDLIAHWDDDDYSHPRRLEEQVNLLQMSSADVVGYSDMLFWRSPRGSEPGASPKGCDTASHAPGKLDCSGEAWLYLGPQKALGTSLLYRRQAWERKPFPNQPRPGFATGEEVNWLKNQILFSIPSTRSLDSIKVREIELPPVNGVCCYAPGEVTLSGEPRMIASIHLENTSGSYRLIGEAPESWRRVPEWDDYCRRVMSLQPGKDDGSHPEGEASANQVNAAGKWSTSYEAFVQDMGLRPPGLSIDRIDTNGNYEPRNCRWATKSAQMKGRRLCESQVPSCFCGYCGICRNRIAARRYKALLKVGLR